MQSEEERIQAGAGQSQGPTSKRLMSSFQTSSSANEAVRDRRNITHLAAKARSFSWREESGAGSWAPCPSGKCQLAKGLLTTCVGTPSAESCKPSTLICMPPARHLTYPSPMWLPSGSCVTLVTVPALSPPEQTSNWCCWGYGLQHAALFKHRQIDTCKTCPEHIYPLLDTNKWATTQTNRQCQWLLR